MPPATDEQDAMQQKMMKYMMIFMGVMFFKVASGLCIYFIASSLWGIAERKLLPKPKVNLAGGDSGGGGTSAVPAKKSLPVNSNGAEAKKAEKRNKGRIVLCQPAETDVRPYFARSWMRCFFV